MGATEHGTIEAILPRFMFRVRLDDGRKVTASVKSSARQVSVKFLGADRVEVELSPYDPTRGRITRKL